jgi:hypothetical protein
MGIMICLSIILIKDCPKDIDDYPLDAISRT